RVALQLRFDLASGDTERDQPFARDQDADDAERDDHVTDDLTLLDVLTKRRRLDQERQELTARDVDAEAHHRAVRGSVHEIGGRLDEPSLRRLTLQLRDRAVLRHPQIAAVGDDIERADADDVLVDLAAVRGDDAEIRQLLDLAELARLARELEPQPLDLLDRRQAAARAGLRRELRQKLVAVGKLDVRQRVREERARVAGNLLQHAEELAQRTETLVELSLHLDDQELVLLEASLELFAAPLLRRLTLARLLEQLILLRLRAPELLEALLMLAIVARLPPADQIEEVPKAARFVLRVRRSRGDREAERSGCNEAVDLHPNSPGVGQWEP